MIIYSLKRWIWDAKPVGLFGGYEFGWVQCRNSSKTEVFSTKEALYDYVKKTYKLDKKYFKWVNNRTEEIQYVTDVDRYRIILYSEEIK